MWFKSNNSYYLNSCMLLSTTICADQSCRILSFLYSSDYLETDWSISIKFNWTRTLNSYKLHSYLSPYLCGPLTPLWLQSSTLIHHLIQVNNGEQRLTLRFKFIYTSPTKMHCIHSGAIQGTLMGEGITHVVPSKRSVAYQHLFPP